MSPNHHGHSPPVYHRTPPGQVQKSCYGHYGLSIQKQLHLGCTWWKIQMSQYWHGANKGRAAPVSGRQFKSPPKMTWGSAPALYDNIGRMLQASSFSTDIQKITIELIAGWADWNSVWYCTYYYILYVLRYACSWLQLYVCRHVYNLLYIYVYMLRVYSRPANIVSGPPGHLLQICTSPATFAPAAHQLLIFTHSLMAITCHSPRKKSCPFSDPIHHGFSSSFSKSRHVAPAPVCTWPEGGECACILECSRKARPHASQDESRNILEHIIHLWHRTCLGHGYP
jgi:hypothetical protein